MSRLDLVGQKYGRLLVVSVSEASTKAGICYNCLCDCGITVEVFTNGLRTGRVKSCGCLNSELVTERNITHGLRYHPLYTVWHSMINRCCNEKASNYDYYGGRGIKVTERWLGDNGLVNFIDDMGSRPENTSIDRVDTNGDYSPENCQWVCKEMQSFNRRHKGNSDSIQAGVYKFKKKKVWTGKWKAIISVDGKRKYLGTFDTEEDAIAARKAAELEYYGMLKPTL